MGQALNLGSFLFKRNGRTQAEVAVVQEGILQCLGGNKNVFMLHVFGDALKCAVVQGGTIHVHLRRVGVESG